MVLVLRCRDVGVVVSFWMNSVGGGIVNLLLLRFLRCIPSMIMLETTHHQWYQLLLIIVLHLLLPQLNQVVTAYEETDPDFMSPEVRRAEKTNDIIDNNDIKLDDDYDDDDNDNDDNNGSTNNNRRRNNENYADIVVGTKGNDSNSNGDNKQIWLEVTSNVAAPAVAGNAINDEKSAMTTTATTTVKTTRTTTTRPVRSSLRTALLCTQTHMTIVIAAPKDFTGYVYAEGHFHDPLCKFPIDTKLSMQIPYNRCGTEETATTYSNVIIVQKHPKMMTADDEVYHVVCPKNRLQSNDVQFQLESGYEVKNDIVGTAKKVYTDLNVRNRSKSTIIELYA